MIKLTDTEKTFLQTNFPFVIFKPREVRVKSDISATIPSKEFPLSQRGGIKVFDYGNMGLPDYPLLAKIFNETEFETGKCYKNTKRLVENYKRAGVKGIHAYAGWVIGIEGAVLHHAWATFETDGHACMLDGSLKRNLFDYIRECGGNRQLIIERMKQDEGLPNTEKKVYGYLVPELIYVGTRTTPDEALKIWEELCHKYPNHPAYQRPGQNQYGRSRFQEQMAEAGLN